MRVYGQSGVVDTIKPENPTQKRLLEKHGGLGYSNMPGTITMLRSRSYSVGINYNYDSWNCNRCKKEITNISSRGMKKGNICQDCQYEIKLKLSGVKPEHRKIMKWQMEHPEKIKQYNKSKYWKNPQKQRDIAKQKYLKIKQDPIKLQRLRENKARWKREYIRRKKLA